MIIGGTDPTGASATHRASWNHGFEKAPMAGPRRANSEMVTSLSGTENSLASALGEGKASVAFMLFAPNRETLGCTTLPSILPGLPKASRRDPEERRIQNNTKPLICGKGGACSVTCLSS
jgi:hypothetical protein